MANATTQMSTRFYEDYLNSEITFTKDIIRTLKMDPRQIYVKINGAQWPCIINSASFSLARIILGKKGKAFQDLAVANPPPVNIKISFYQNDGQLISFFVSGKVQQIQPYMNSSELAIITISFTQRPPEDMILLIGNIFDANANAIRRKEDRIIVTPDTLRKINITKKEIVANVQGIPRNCILQDFSFGGARIILMGVAQFLLNKDISINIVFAEPDETFTLKGKIMAANAIEGRKELVIANIHFDDASVPLNYKIRINNFIATAKKEELRRPTLGPITPSSARTPVAGSTPAATEANGSGNNATPAADAQKPAQAAPDAANTSLPADATTEKPADAAPQSN